MTGVQTCALPISPAGGRMLVIVDVSVVGVLWGVDVVVDVDVDVGPRRDRFNTIFAC